MGGAELPPALGEALPIGFVAPVGQIKPRLDSQRDGVTSGVARIGAHALNHVPRLLVGRHLWEPSIAQAGDTAQRRVYVPTYPDRHRAPHGQGIDANRVNVVPAARERDGVLAPQRPQHLNLLVAAHAALAEIGVEALELDLAPADADAQPQASAR